MVNSPKRNKSKDNPYTLGYDESKNIYIVEFKDNKQINQRVEINKEIYEAFNAFELEDISQIHKFRKHIEHSEVYDYTLYKRAIKQEKNVFDIVENNITNEILKQAINELPEIQKRRLKKYYFQDKTFEQIAKEENCTKRAVKFTIDIALEKISKKFKN